MDEKKGAPATVDDYIAQFPEDVRQVLDRIRAVVKAAAPDAVEKISYGMAGYYLNGGLVWFGAYKRHIGFYPRTAAMDAVEGFSAYGGTKGSVHFPLDQSMPFELIAEIVKARVRETRKK